MRRYQNMTVGVEWKRRKSKEARTTFTTSAAA
jgi:hypothetical protein